MCGFAGFLSFRKLNSQDMPEVLLNMNNAIKHRGPDNYGFWVDNDSQIAMGHRRLSILDLSDAGHQPMISSSGRYIIVFNGEIYNHIELRNKLAAKDSQKPFDFLGVSKDARIKFS